MIEKDVVTYSAIGRILISNLIGLTGGIVAYFCIDNTLFTLLVVSIPLSLATQTILSLCAKNETESPCCPTCGQPLPKDHAVVTSAVKNFLENPQ